MTKLDALISLYEKITGKELENKPDTVTEILNLITEDYTAADSETIKEVVVDWLNDNPDAITSLTDEQENKLDAIILDGDGKSVLLNDGTYVDFEENVKNVVNQSGGVAVLDGKKILFIGDSICEGVGASGQPYPYWIQQWNENANVYNLGVGGMTIAQKDSSITNSMPVRILNGEFENEDYSDSDIIVFEGGINDLMNNVKLGYIQSSYDIKKYNTFCQGMEYMFNYFKTLFPKARMIFLSTHYVTAHDYNKSKAWWGAASEICAKWGIEFLDIFSLLCTEKIDGLQLHPDYLVHKDYYARYLEMTLTASCPISGARTTNYYKQNVPCMLQFHSGTKSINVGDEISTSDWRINMARADLTTYENVSTKVTYDTSDVNNMVGGTYPVHVSYTEDGITLAIDVDVTVIGEGVEKTLDSITAAKTITSYKVGSNVSTDDITVIAHYTDGSEEDVTEAAQFDTSNINKDIANQYSILVTYTEEEITKTTTIQVSIIESGAITIIASGTTNDNTNKENITWSLNSNGVLTFSTDDPNVSMGAYNAGSQPWYSYITQIKKAVFASNIISTGSNVLQNATSLTEVEFENESIKVGAGAFKGCTSLS